MTLKFWSYPIQSYRRLRKLLASSVVKYMGKGAPLFEANGLECSHYGNYCEKVSQS